MKLEEIVNEAESLLSEYSNVIPLRFWLRSADAIQKQVTQLVRLVGLG
jgi:hypothetical protein